MTFLMPSIFELVNYVVTGVTTMMAASVGKGLCYRVDIDNI